MCSYNAVQVRLCRVAIPGVKRERIRAEYSEVVMFLGETHVEHFPYSSIHQAVPNATVLDATALTVTYHSRYYTLSGSGNVGVQRGTDP